MLDGARVTCVILLAGAVACGGGQAPTAPATLATPTPAPIGTFTVLSASPAFGGGVSGQDSDLQGTTALTVTFQMTYADPVPFPFFVLQLMNGQTECLRSAIAYCARTDGGPQASYTPGAPATYRCPFFVRDSTQSSCGARFTTDHMRFVLQGRPSATSAPETLFTQDATGGWTFGFAR